MGVQLGCQLVHVNIGECEGFGLIIVGFMGGALNLKFGTRYSNFFAYRCYSEMIIVIIFISLKRV